MSIMEVVDGRLELDIETIAMFERSLLSPRADIPITEVPIETDECETVEGCSDILSIEDCTGCESGYCPSFG